MIVSPYPAFAVLEVNAGDVAAKGIKIGDTVNHKIFNRDSDVKNADVAPVAEDKNETDVSEEKEPEAPAESVASDEAQTTETEKKAEE